MYPEDIQNRVRNAVSPIQVLKDICDNLVNSSDEKNLNDTYKYLKNSNLLEATQRSIDKLIVIARACDSKINDKNFNIESYIKQMNYDQ